MPRPLRSAPPSSAIARLLDAQALRANTAPDPFPPSISASSMPMRQAGRRTGESAQIKRELVLTASADQTLTLLVGVFRTATGAKLTHSHLARAVLRLLAERLDVIQEEAARLPARSLPSNAPGHEHARDQFEQALTDALAAALARGRR